MFPYILKIIIFINASIIHCTYTITYFIEVLSLKLDFVFLCCDSSVSFAMLYYNSVNVFQCVRASLINNLQIKQKHKIIAWYIYILQEI